MLLVDIANGRYLDARNVKQDLDETRAPAPHADEANLHRLFGTRQRPRYPGGARQLQELTSSHLS
jgi:hypothetical protein